MEEALKSLEYLETYIRNMQIHLQYGSVGENNDFPMNLIKEVITVDENTIIDRDAFLKYILSNNNVLTERERYVLFRRYHDNLTLRQIATENNVTQERIRQVIARSIRKLRHPQRVMDYTCVTKAEYNNLKTRYDNLKSVYNKKYCDESNQEVYPLYDMTLEELELSVRSYNCLRRAGIKNLKDITDKTELEIRRVRNLGKKSVKEITDKLSELGVSFKNG